MTRRQLIGFLAVCIAIFVDAGAYGIQTPDEQKVFEIRSRLRQLPRPQEVQKEPPTTRGTAAVAPGIVVLQIEFKLGSSDLLEEHRHAVEALGQAISGDPFLKDNIFVVEGHTCNLGSAKVNKALAGKRAAAVIDYLVRTYRIPKEQFRLENYGMSKPVYSNATAEGRQKNRRVVIRNTFENRCLGAVMKVLDESGALITVNTNLDLQPRQKFAVEISPREQLYTYAYLVFSNGEAQQLFPNLAYTNLSNPLLPGKLCRIPAFGRWLEMKGPPGEELLMVIGARSEVPNPFVLCQRLSAAFTGENWVPASSGNIQNVAKQQDSHQPRSRGIGGVITIPPEEQKAPAGLAPEPAPAPGSSPGELPPDLTIWVRQFRHTN